MYLHVGVQLVFLGKRTATQVAQVRTHASVHRAQMPSQHLAQQEATTALPALETTLAAMGQHVTGQLTATGTLPGAHVTDELLLLVDRVDVVLVASIGLEHGATQWTLHRSFLPHRPGGRRRFLLLRSQVVRLLVNETMHAQVERVLHATATLWTLVCPRVGSHVHQELLV